MFPLQFFHGHLNVRLCLWSTFNDIIDLIYFFTLIDGNISLILITLDVLIFCFEAWE